MVKKTDAEVYKLAEETAKTKFQWVLLQFLLDFFTEKVPKPTKEEQKKYDELRADFEQEEGEISNAINWMKKEYPADAAASARKNNIFNIGYHSTLLKACLSHNEPDGTTIFKNHPDINDEYTLAWDSRVCEWSKGLRAKWESNVDHFDGAFADTNSAFEAQIAELKKELASFEEPRHAGTNKTVINHDKVLTKARWDAMVKKAQKIGGDFVNGFGFVLYAVATLPFAIVNPMGQKKDMAYFGVADVLENSYDIIPEKGGGWCNWSTFSKADVKFLRAQKSIYDAAYDFKTKPKPAENPAAGGGRQKRPAKMIPARVQDESVEDYFHRAPDGLYDDKFDLFFIANYETAFDMCCNCPVNPGQGEIWKEVDAFVACENETLDPVDNYKEILASKLAEADDIVAALAIVHVFEDYAMFLPPDEITTENYDEVALVTGALILMEDAQMVGDFKEWVASKLFTAPQEIVPVVELATSIDFPPPDEEEWFDEDTLKAFMALDAKARDAAYAKAYPTRGGEEKKKGKTVWGPGATSPPAPASPHVKTKESGFGGTPPTKKTASLSEGKKRARRAAAAQSDDDEEAEAKGLRRGTRMVRTPNRLGGS